MKKVIIQKYFLNKDFSIKDLETVSEQIKKTEESLAGSYLVAIMAAPGSFMESIKSRILSLIKGPIPGSTFYMLNGACRQISAIMLHTILRAGGTHSRLIDGSRLDLLIHKNSIKDRIIKLTVNRFKSIVYKNKVNVIYNNNLSLTKAKRKKLYEDPDRFPFTLASIMGAKTLEILLPKQKHISKLISKFSNKKIAAEITYHDLIEMLPHLPEDFLTREIILYAKSLKIQIVIRDLSSGRPLFHIKASGKKKQEKNLSLQTIRKADLKTDIVRILLNHKTIRIPLENYSKLLDQFADSEIVISNLRYNSIAGAKAVSFLVKKVQLEETQMMLEYQKKNLRFKDMIIDTHLDLLTVKGDPFNSLPRVLAEIGRYLDEKGIEFEITESSETRLSLLIPETDSARVLKYIKKTFLV